MVFRSIKAPKRKKRAQFDTETIALEHDIILADINTFSALCYTDGSASPNPGPCGAGATIFLRNPDRIIDLGASLGRGTNNYAELYALGTLFEQLTSLKIENPTLYSAHVFSDSKLALGAAVSRKSPLTNSLITRGLRLAYDSVVASGLVVCLHCRPRSGVTSG